MKYLLDIGYVIISRLLRITRRVKRMCRVCSFSTKKVRELVEDKLVQLVENRVFDQVFDWIVYQSVGFNTPQCARSIFVSLYIHVGYSDHEL